MTIVILLPGNVASYETCVWLLHGDQNRVVQRIVMKLRHRAKISLIVVAFKNLVYTLLQPLRDLPDLFLSLLRCIFVCAWEILWVS